MFSLPPIEDTVHDSINLIERTFMQRCGEEARRPHEPVHNWAFKHGPARKVFSQQAKLVRLTALERKMPLLWLTRKHFALDTLTNFLCAYGEIDPDMITQGYMMERDFPALTNACGVVAASALRMADVETTKAFKEMARQLAKDCNFDYILCDWALSPGEEIFALRLAANADVSVGWPR